jgi:acyl-CoA dehydrogenase
VDFRIDEDDRSLREALRRTLDDSAPPATRRAADPPPIDAGRWRQLASAGWFEGFVGAGGSHERRIPAVRGLGLAEEFGRRPPTEPIAMAAGFLVPLLRALPSTAASQLAEEVVAGRLIATGPTAHVPAADDDGVWGYGATTPVLRAGPAIGVLDGQVPGVEVPPEVTTLCTPARTEDGRAVMVAVPVTEDGLHLEVHDTILPGRRLADVTLEAVPVRAADQLLVDDHEVIAAPLIAARVTYGLFLDGLALGGAQAVVDRSLTYAHEREQFGVPIGTFQAVKHLVADAVVALEGARSLTYHLAWEVQEHGGEADLEGLAASRINAARMYREVAEMGIQVRGATGFTWEDGAHRWLRAATFDALQATRGKRLEQALAAHLLDAPPS